MMKIKKYAVSDEIHSNESLAEISIKASNFAQTHSQAEMKVVDETYKGLEG